MFVFVINIRWHVLTLGSFESDREPSPEFPEQNVQTNLKSRALSWRTPYTLYNLLGPICRNLTNNRVMCNKRSYRNDLIKVLA